MQERKQTMNVSTQPKLYQSDGPTVYSNSSVMSPDRRELYLSHKSGSRQVFQLPESITVAATKDPRFPIDLCCVHWGDSDGPKKDTLVCFSSKMIVVAKIQAISEILHQRLVRHISACVSAIDKSTYKLTEEETKLLPRRKGQRTQNSYARIPLSSDGRVLLTSETYPATPSVDEKDSLNTSDWYVWLSIIFETGNTANTARTSVDNTNYFVLQNDYHTIIQAL